MARIQLHRSYNLTVPTSYTNYSFGPGEQWMDFDGGYRMTMTTRGDDTMRDLYLTQNGSRVFSMTNFLISTHPSDPLIQEALDSGNYLPIWGKILAGNDDVTGSAGRDVVDGLIGNDIIRGAGGNDILRGGAGNDRLFGGAGNDNLNGGAGNDNIIADAGNDRLVGGVGNDRLVGGVGNDRLFGGAGNDNLNGGAGNDNLVGGIGNDVMDGGAGYDRFVAGQGTDVVRGGSGVDTLEFQTSAKVTVDLTLGRAQAFQGGWVTVSGVENLRSGAGHDRLLGNAQGNVLDGGIGNDLLMGRAGNDVLRGGAGNDRLDGGIGNDVLAGGLGADRFIFRPASGQDKISDFADVQDSIVFSAGPDHISDLRILDRGTDTVIRYGADSITLVNVDHRLIDEADFVFA